MFLRISMEIMQINTPQLVKDSKNSSGLQICVGLRNIFNIVHPFWASVGFLGYQMEPCAKGSSSRCMDMLLWSVLPRHARRINSNDLFGPSVNKKSWKKHPLRGPLNADPLSILDKLPKELRNPSPRSPLWRDFDLGSGKKMAGFSAGDGQLACIFTRKDNWEAYHFQRFHSVRYLWKDLVFSW